MRSWRTRAAKVSLSHDDYRRRFVTLIFTSSLRPAAVYRFICNTYFFDLPDFMHDELISCDVDRSPATRFDMPNTFAELIKKILISRQRRAHTPRHASNVELDELHSWHNALKCSLNNYQFGVSFTTVSIAGNNAYLFS